MFSYLFSSVKKDEVKEVKEVDLVKQNEELKAQILTLLAEKEELEKTIKHLKIDSSVYRDLMFTKLCNCSSKNINMYD